MDSEDNKRYGLRVSATAVYDYPTLREFSVFIEKELEKHGRRQVAPSMQTAPRPSQKSYLDYEKEETGVEKESLDNLSLQKHNRTICWAPAEQEKTSAQEGIAIIGMSGQFPKSKTLTAFWDNLANAKDCISEIPTELWPIDKYYDPNPGVPGKTCCRWMGVLEVVDKFDPLIRAAPPLWWR